MMLVIVPFWTSFLIRIYAWINILQHVLDGVLRQFNLDAGLGFKLLDRLEQRVVFGFVEALAEPDGDGLLLGHRGCGGVKQPDRSDRE